MVGSIRTAGASRHGGGAASASMEVDMHPILDKTQLSPNVTRLVVSAPRIAEVRQPGPVRHRAPAARAPSASRSPSPTPTPARAPSRWSSRRSARAPRTCARCEPGDAITRHRRPAGQADRAHRVAATPCASAAAWAPRSSIPSPRASHARGRRGHQRSSAAAPASGSSSRTSCAATARSSSAPTTAATAATASSPTRSSDLLDGAAASTWSTPSARCP